LRVEIRRYISKWLTTYRHHFPVRRQCPRIQRGDDGWKDGRDELLKS
jgi:hypothetical protein